MSDRIDMLSVLDYETEGRKKKQPSKSRRNVLTLLCVGVGAKNDIGFSSEIFI